MCSSHEIVRFESNGRIKRKKKIRSKAGEFLFAWLVNVLRTLLIYNVWCFYVSGTPTAWFLAPSFLGFLFWRTRFIFSPPGRGSLCLSQNMLSFQAVWRVVRLQCGGSHVAVDPVVFYSSHPRLYFLSLFLLSSPFPAAHYGWTCIIHRNFVCYARIDEEEEEDDTPVNTTPSKLPSSFIQLAP